MEEKNLFTLVFWSQLDYFSVSSSIDNGMLDRKKGDLRPEDSGSASGSGINIVGLLCSSVKMKMISVLSTSQSFLSCGSKEKVDVKVWSKCSYHENMILRRVSIVIRQNGKEIQLTIEILNTTFVISREVKYVGVNITVGGEHYGLWIIGMLKTQGMAKLMNSN